MLFVHTFTIPAHASSSKEVEIVARTLRFLYDIASEVEANIGVLADCREEVSRRHSADIKSQFMDVGKSSGPALSVRIIDVSELEEIKSVDLVFVTAGLKNFQPAIFAIASRNEVLTVSTDPGCLDAGYCVMWVKAKPVVQIVIHHAAAEASRLHFQTAFRMLITER